MHMTRTDSLIRLVGNLTKQERKDLAVWFNRQPPSDYRTLYMLLMKNSVMDSAELKRLFLSEASGDSYNSAVAYLFDLLLRRLAEFRRESDSYYMLFNKLLQARVLFDKSMYGECYSLIEEVKQTSRYYNNHFTLMLAQRMEIEYRLMSDFCDLEEKQILDNHSQINRTVQIISKFNEQTSLYELIRYRMLRYGHVRTETDARMLDDLVSSELQIISSAKTKDDFEMQKNHKLFQAYYFIMCGHYNSAVRAFKELHQLFEDNRHLWYNPPVYYLSTVAGMLESLRAVRDYNGIEFFIGKLRRLKSKSVRFMISVKFVIFVNTLYPLIDRGDFVEAQRIVDEDKDGVVRHSEALTLNERAELLLCTTLIRMCNGRLKEARHRLRTQMGIVQAIDNTMLANTLRIVNTMIYFELGDSEFVASQCRSIMRELNRRRGKEKHGIEILLLKFMTNYSIPSTIREREMLWEKQKAVMRNLALDRSGSQILMYFDFTMWIKAKILARPIADVIAEEARCREQREVMMPFR